MPDKVQFVDLKAQYLSIKTEMDEAISGIVSNTAFIKGPALAGFEADFAQALGTAASHVIGCANGTCAVTSALRAVGVGPGDEVILPSHTFFATVESVVQLGAIPVFVDIQETDYTVDPEAVEAAVSSRTKAILPVHIYGAPCNMTRLAEIASTHGLALVEDCAQAHLAQWDGETVSTIGDAAGFSFYPGKNLGAYGDAGAIVIKDADQATAIRKYVDHGRLDKYLHDAIGDNLRMDGLQAAVLSVKLKHLSAWTDARRRVAQRYDAALKAAGFKVIEPPANAKAVYHLYIVEVADREHVQSALADRNIATGVHYPVPCHAQPAMRTTEHRISGELKTTETIAQNIISLPIFPELGEGQQDRVIEEFLGVARPAGL